jgi:hypothetical protein
MATTTTNFGWDIPQSTDLVKDGATAIAALGQDIDTAFVDLKGGTTGQVLAKASGTDLDFSWVAQDDSNAIQNAIVDAKGDLIAATAADTPARLPVGTNGQVLTADSAEATGLKWATSASGGMTVLASGSLSGSSLSLTSISGSYNNLQLVLIDYALSNQSTLTFTANSVTSYSWLKQATANSTTASSQLDTQLGDTVVYLGFDANQTGDNNNLCVLTLLNYANTTARKLVQNQHYLYTSSNKNQIVTQLATVNDAAAITSITIAVPVGTFTGGTYILYGVK